MTSRVIFRGLSLSLLATLAIAVGGCAEAPEQVPTDVSPALGEVSSELDIDHPDAPPGGGVDRSRLDSVEHPGSPDRDGERGEEQSEPATGFDPGSTKSEPVPVPWVPHFASANDA